MKKNNIYLELTQKHLGTNDQDFFGVGVGVGVVVVYFDNGKKCFINYCPYIFITFI